MSSIGYPTYSIRSGRVYITSVAGLWVDSPLRQRLVTVAGTTHSLVRFTHMLGDFKAWIVVGASPEEEWMLTPLTPYPEVVLQAFAAISGARIQWILDPDVLLAEVGNSQRGITTSRAVSDGREVQYVRCAVDDDGKIISSTDGA